MSKFTALTEELHDYIVAKGAREDDLLRRLRAETEERFPEQIGMQIGADQGAFMTMLARLIGARRALEIGTFTGYSAICTARGLAPGGRLVACDMSDEYTRVARRYWEEARLADAIELRLGPALETLAALPDDEPFDLAFIDADKLEYVDYYEHCLRLVRPGGLILVDNVLGGGMVVGEPPEERARFVEGIKRLNDHVADDERVDLAMVPVADGLTMARKR